MKKLYQLIVKFDQYAVKFLKHMQIYFETVIMVCLSILTIRITHISNELNQLAILNDEKKNTPTFVLKETENENFRDTYFDLYDLDEFTNSTYHVDHGELVWEELDSAKLFDLIAENDRLISRYNKLGELEFINSGFDKIIKYTDNAYLIYNSGSHQITNVHYDFATYLFLVRTDEYADYYHTALLNINDKYRTEKNSDYVSLQNDDDICDLISGYIDKEYPDTFDRYDFFHIVNVTFENYKGDQVTESFVMDYDDEMLINTKHIKTIDLSSHLRRTYFEDITTREFWDQFLTSGTWTKCTEQEFNDFSDSVYPYF